MVWSSIPDADGFVRASRYYLSVWEGLYTENNIAIVVPHCLMGPNTTMVFAPNADAEPTISVSLTNTQTVI